MEPENEVDKELRDELVKLHRDVTRQRKEGADPNEIEQHTADFEMEWQDRLVLEQKTETRGRQIKASEHIVEQEWEARGQASVKDNDLMRGMSPEAQIAYWENAPSRAGMRHEHDLAQKTNAESERVATDTKTKYAAIGHALTQSLGKIGRGQEPDFDVLLKQQIDKEQALTDKKQAFEDLVKQHQHGHDREP